MSPAEQRRRTAGVLAAAGSYLIWGLFPLYFKALRDVPPPEVLAHRIAWSVLFMALLVTGLRRWGDAARQLRVPGTIPTLAASALLISTNWLVYIWAVGAGLVLEASLGYFVNPLVTVLLGVFFLREPLSGRQKLAIGLAAGGVLVLMVHVGRPPWVAMTLALTFGLYGLLRKRAQVDAITGLLAEVVLLLPLAAAWLGWQGWHGTLRFGTETGTTALLAAAGVVTAVPLILFAVGVRRLRLSTVGLLQYLNPTMQFSLAVFLFGESFSRWHAAAFGCIWVSLIVYTADALGARPRGGARRPRCPRRSSGRSAAQVGVQDLRVPRQLGGRAGVDDPPHLHDVAAVGQLERGAGVLLHQQDGHAGRLVDLADGLEDGAHQQRRQPQRGLVEQEQARPGHEGPADGQHLLLAAGEGAGQLLAALVQDREEPRDEPAGLLQPARVAPREGAQVEVLPHRQGAEDAPPLGHLGDAEPHQLVRLDGVDRLPLEVDLAAAGAQQAADGLEGGRLAGAVGAQDGDDLALADLEVDAVQRLHVAVGDAQALDLEEGGGGAHVSSAPR